MQVTATPPLARSPKRAWLRLLAWRLRRRVAPRRRPERTRQTAFATYLALVSFVVMVPYTVLFLVDGKPVVALSTSLVYLALFSTLVLIDRGRPTIARHLLLAACNFGIFAFAASPRGSGTEVLYFGMIANSVLIFRPDELRHLIFALFQPLAYYWLLRATDVRIFPFPVWSEALFGIQRLVIDGLTLVLLASTLLVFVVMGRKSEARAEATRRRLASEIALVKLLQEVAAIANGSDDYAAAFDKVALCVAERMGWELGTPDDPLATAASARREPCFRAEAGKLVMAFAVGPGALVFVKAGTQPPSMDMLATMRGVSHQLEALASRLEAQAQNEEHRLGMLAASKMALIGEMYTGIAHEINNPLSVIQGHLARIERSIGTPEQDARTRAAVADVHTTIRRITRIISGLRGFARDFRNEPLENVSLATIVQDSVSMLETRISKLGVTLTVEDLPPESDDACECRPIQISQVLVNLLSNACDAVEGQVNRNVRIYVRDHGDRFVVTVADSGAGVPTELRDKIMQPFFTTKPEGKGTGLGLSISSDIVARHGGHIELESMDGETHFHLHLPKRV